MFFFLFLLSLATVGSITESLGMNVFAYTVATKGADLKQRDQNESWIPRVTWRDIEKSFREADQRNQLWKLADGKCTGDRAKLLEKLLKGSGYLQTHIKEHSFLINPRFSSFLPPGKARPGPPRRPDQDHSLQAAQKYDRLLSLPGW